MTTPQPAALPELPEGVTLEDLLIPLRSALNTCHDSDWTLRQFKTHITHALAALAALQSQPAADVSSGHIKEPYTLAELNARIASNDYNAELLLQHAMLLLNAQPAAAGVSDEEAKYVEQIMEQAQVFASAWSLVGSRFDFGNALDDANEAKDELRALVARAILALRPQSTGETFDQWLKREQPAGAVSDMERGWNACAASLRPQAVPMTDEQRREVFMAGYEAAEQDATVCRVPPHGWHCTRKAGHEGPCAAVETDDAELVQRGMDRLREAHHGITAQGAHGEQA